MKAFDSGNKVPGNQQQLEIECSRDVLDRRQSRIHGRTLEIRDLPLTESQFVSQLLLAELTIQTSVAEHLEQPLANITFRGCERFGITYIGYNDNNIIFK